jgi:hypothetical protein
MERENHKEAHAGCCEPAYVHTQVALLVGRIHMCVSLLTCHVHIDRLVYVED